MYSADPLVDVILTRPSRPQKSRHQVAFAFSRDAAVASLPRSVVAVVAAAPPLHAGAPTTTRNDPSSFGWKLTAMLVAPLVAACTLRPPAVSAASAPKRCPDPPSVVLSVQVSESVAIAPEACACGARPVQRLTLALCIALGSAPVTSTTSSSLSART